MILTILGSGTCVPSVERNAPGYLLESDGTSLLLDCGCGTLIQLEKAGRSYAAIDAVFITHRHPDHFSDLMPLVHALLAAPGCDRRKDLHIFGPKLFIDYYHRAFSPVLFSSGKFSTILHEASGKFDFDPFNIMTAKTLHSDDSIAYRFECGGRALVYTGDTDYDPAVVKLAEDADLLVADCSFPARMKVRNHLSAEECGMLAKEAGVRRLVLSHLYPAGMPEQERVEEAASAFGGEIILAEDLMKIKV